MLIDLELHITMAHPPTINTRNDRVRDFEVRPDKFPRPEISDPATDTDWQYFVASWEAYKRATRLTGQEAWIKYGIAPPHHLRRKYLTLVFAQQTLRIKFWQASSG